MNREALLSARPASPTLSGALLQRKCDCGNTMGGVACTSCREKNEVAMQRSPGQSLDTSTRSFLKPPHMRDFSQVQTHATGIPPITLQRQTSDVTGDPEVPNPDDFLKLLFHANRNTLEKPNPLQTQRERHGIIPPIPSTSPLFKQPNVSMLAPWASSAINLNLPPVDAPREPGIGFNRGPFRFFAGKSEENNSPGGSPPKDIPSPTWISKSVGKLLEHTEGNEIGIKLSLNKLKRKRHIVTF